MTDFNKMTVLQIKEYAKTNNFKIPSGLRKDGVIQFLNGAIKERLSGIKKEPVKTIALNIVQSRSMQGDWLTHLHTAGWAVVPIPGWKPEFVDMFFAFLESCSDNFKKDDRRTWKPENMPFSFRGMLKNYFGHTEMQWQIRELCVPIFAKAWGLKPEDLLCSFDGGCFYTPTNEQKDPRNWTHNDTPRNSSEIYNFACVQGIVNFVDNDAKDGGLLLVEGSHTIFKEYMDKHPSEGISWGMADMNDPLLSSRNLIKICAPAGHLILFDSRTFHCNIPPSRDNFRMCLYVCMEPRAKATEAELIKRRQLYEQGLMTGHITSGLWFAASPKDPHTYGKPSLRPLSIEIAPLNPLRSRLIGY